MQFLEANESSYLHSILTSHILIANETARADMLINCGLASLLHSLSTLSNATALFVNELCARLSQAHVVAQPSGQPGLVALLNYLSLPPYDVDLSPEEKRFLEYVKQECLRWHASQKERLSVVAQTLTRERRHDQAPSFTRTRRAIEREQLIVNYDLFTLMAEFANQVNYGKAAAFSLGGDYSILRGYVVERMRQHLLTRMPGQYQVIELSFDTHDIADDNDALLKKVMLRNGCTKLPDLFEKAPKMHLMLVIWCYSISPEQIAMVASRFWNEVEDSVVPFLQAQNRSFALVLANVEAGGKPYQVDKFSQLSMPAQFEMTELLAWVRGKLENLDIEKSDIDYCLERVKEQRGDIVRTYHALGYVASYLQERYN